MRGALIGVITVVSAAMLVGSGSLASASVRPALSGTEYIHEVTTSFSTDQAPVIINGAVTAGGVDVSHSLFKFATGTITVVIKPTSQTEHTTKSCLITSYERGTFTFTGGTGNYAGISGSGDFNASTLIILAVNSEGECNAEAGPVAGEIVITGRGHVKL